MTPFWLMLAGAIATSMVGNTLLKYASGAPSFFAQVFDWRSVLGLGLYGVGALLYMMALRKIPMSVALPFNAVSYIAATAIGYFAFHETIGAQHMLAIGLICAGVVLLALV